MERDITHLHGRAHTAHMYKRQQSSRTARTRSHVKAVSGPCSNRGLQRRQARPGTPLSAPAEGEGGRIATCAPVATRATRSHGAIPTAAEVGGRCTLRAGTVALGLVHATMVYSAPGLGACTIAVRLAPLGAWRTTGTWSGLGLGLGLGVRVRALSASEKVKPNPDPDP